MNMETERLASDPFDVSALPGIVRQASFRLCVIIATLCGFAAAAMAHGVGFERIEITSPAERRLAATIFYPSDEIVTSAVIGPYDVLGKRGATPKEGLFPLVVISHGSSGSMLSHHDTASYLAARGFLVAAVEHAGDNFQDPSGLGKTSTAYRRAQQVSAVIDSLLESAYRSQIDGDRIGILGYSAGSVTALMLAGAEPVFGNLVDYCADRKQLTSLCEGGGRLVHDQAGRRLPVDPRIRAALLFAPLGILFPQEQIARVSVPVGIVFAQDDRELPPDLNVVPLAEKLQTLTLLEYIPLAGHTVFLAPCTERLAAIEKALCTDPPFVDRQREHSLLNAMAASFFGHAFNIARPPLTRASK